MVNVSVVSGAVLDDDIAVSGTAFNRMAYVIAVSGTVDIILVGGMS